MKPFPQKKHYYNRFFHPLISDDADKGYLLLVSSSLSVFLQDLKALIYVVTEDFLNLFEYLLLMEILKHCLKFSLPVPGDKKRHRFDGMDFFSERIEAALTFPDIVTFVASVEALLFTARGIRTHPVR